MNSVIARSGVAPQSGAQPRRVWLSVGSTEKLTIIGYFAILERIWYLLYDELPRWLNIWLGRGKVNK